MEFGRKNRSLPLNICKYSPMMEGIIGHFEQKIQEHESFVSNVQSSEVVLLSENYLLDEFQECQPETENGFSHNFMCNECGSSLSSKKSLAMHVSRQHKNRKEYKCNLCDKVYTRIENLSLHVRKFHSKKIGK
ncbi:zinc finger protein 665-like [Limulus polyphemus]|uniref:Zinc finger protein 665-like n=1 Tax=Limulus polyphemus TaxID=6850 RepID=A0ABM1TAZ4_LIMPO|nr:zinc finger protein 665-like [Limulus polyphemus]